MLDFMCNPKLVHILVKLKGQNELGQKLASPTKLCPDFFGETRYILYYHMARQSAPPSSSRLGPILPKMMYLLIC